MGNHMIQQLIRLYQSITQRFASERGAVLIYVALILPLLIGVAALAIDGSNAYAQQRRMQTAADAAALAGAQRLALGGDSAAVQSAVQSLATANRATGFTWAAIDGNTGVRVTVERTFDTFFAGSIGRPTLTVGATAAARYVSVSGAGNLMPMAIPEQPGGFAFGQPYSLKDDGKIGPGSFGWLSWQGNPSAKTLEDNIKNHSNSGVWHIGQHIPSAGGTMNSSGVWSELTAWIGKAVTIPVYDSYNESNKTYRISGFAEFTITHVSRPDVVGTFSRTLIRGESIGGGTADYGVRDVRMTQ